MIEKKVTFETKCWKNDWEILLKTDYLKQMISRNDFSFEKKILFINNVKDYQEVEDSAKRLIDKGVLTNFYIVKDYADEALDFFKIKKDSFGQGYYYSIAELVSIYLCETKYLLHYSSDAILEKKISWIPQAMEKMENNPQIKVANPVWNRKYKEAKKESFQEDDAFYTGFGFSDQCYLVKTQDFKAQIYNEQNEASKRYPKYGGELFEKRVDSWMRNNNFQRITYKKGSYLHKNFPKSAWRRKLMMFMLKY